MLPLTLIRSQPDIVREALRRRREDEALVDEVIEAFAQRFDIEVNAHGAGRETIVFNLPRELRSTTPSAA